MNKKRKPFPAHPFVKWAGGKTQILEELISRMPKEYGSYYEPFVGGGALLFKLQPKEAHINDGNRELIAAYKTFKNKRTLGKMKELLVQYESNHSEDNFYAVREMDRKKSFKRMTNYELAARMIYLNKTCFNGLYRVNADGYFNVPSAKKDPKKLHCFDENNFKAIKSYYKNSKIFITCGDYEEAVKNAQPGDFVYFDPPYDVYPDKLGFVDYGKDGFGKEEQSRLARVFRELSEKGVFVMASNHNTQYINELYEGFKIEVIKARRNINSKGDGRGEVEEVIITNY